MTHVTDKRVLPEEQKALRKGRLGCLDTLAIDGKVAEETKSYSRSLSVAWIDCLTTSVRPDATRVDCENALSNTSSQAGQKRNKGHHSEMENEPISQDH